MRTELSDIRMRDPFILRSLRWLRAVRDDGHQPVGRARDRVRLLHQHRPRRVGGTDPRVPATGRVLGGHAVLGARGAPHDGRFFMFATFASSDARPGRGAYRSWSPTSPRSVRAVERGSRHAARRPLPRRHAVRRRRSGALARLQPRRRRRPGGSPGIADGEMYALPLSPDLRSAAGEPVLLFTASAAPWSKPLCFPDGVEPPEQLNLAKDPLFTDGPFLVRTEAAPAHALVELRRGGLRHGRRDVGNRIVSGPGSSRPSRCGPATAATG